MKTIFVQLKTIVSAKNKSAKHFSLKKKLDAWLEAQKAKRLEMLAKRADRGAPAVHRGTA